jgi:hypothetical protein
MRFDKKNKECNTIEDICQLPEMDQEQYFSFTEAPIIKIKSLLCVLAGLDDASGKVTKLRFNIKI